MNRNPQRNRYALMIAAAVMLPVAIPALQAEELPGVDGKVAGQTPIRPVGEPIVDTPETDADGFVRVGDWDVKISGSVTVDIGTFAPRTGR
ncbi:hypothetical protein [Allomesorhizobium alhagi]|jgi:hypothetical protein|nr:hypothetical protein [Mesorhizobium alhagi]